MKPKDMLAAFGAFWLLMLVAGALGLIEFRVYAGEVGSTPYFCRSKA